MVKYLSKIGKSLMLPIVVLPVCGILMGIGYFLCAGTVVNPSELTTVIQKIGYILIKTGGIVIDNIALLFVIGVSLGMSDDNHGSVCFAAIVSWLIVTSLLSPDVLFSIFSQLKGNDIINTAFQKIANPFTAIIVGLLSATCYNKFKNVKLNETFAFFSGRRFVIIIVVFLSLVLSSILLVVWPILFSLFYNIGNFILKLGGIGVGIYTFLNRLLIPFGLHHAINSVFWFDTIGIGDLTAYWNGKVSADVGWDVGMYMSGFFPCMMFGIPGAALAMIQTSKNKKDALRFVLPFVICAFFCGLTEPFEFSFMFVAFPLYVVYSFLYGVVAIVTYYFGFRAGFSFSAGALDLFFSSTLPAAQKTILIIPLGIFAFVLFYLVFKLMIKHFNFELNMSKDEDLKDIQNTNIENGQMINSKGYKILNALGGKNNIVNIDCCATRLRVGIKDMNLVSEPEIKKSGAIAFIKLSDNDCQVVIGTTVQQVLEDIKNIMNNDSYTYKKDEFILVKHGDAIDDFFKNNIAKNDLRKSSFDKDGDDKQNVCECEIEYTIKAKEGMHARPAGKIVNIIKSGESKVDIIANGKETSGDSITGIMSLGIVTGTKIKIKIEGKDAKKIKDEIEKYLLENM